MVSKRKRRVKAWALLIDGDLNAEDVRATEQEANADAQEAFEDTPGCTYAVVPCTIEYVPSTKPKRTSARKGK